VHTFHGHVLRDYFAPPLQWWLKHLERRLARHTARLLAVSASCADELAAAGVAERARFHVVPPAVPVVPIADRAAARAQLAIPAEQQRVVCVGRLVPIKRVDHFVRAIAQLDGVHGDVVGDGPLRQELRTGVDAGGRVHWRGAVVGIAANLAAYDALVLPSAREGYPLVVVEARRAGVPVVGYDVPGVRDALAGGGGELVPAAAGPAGLAAALRRVLAPAPATAPRAASDAFAPAAVAGELLDVYRPLANCRAGLP
jgi:glycosyltransferase involved in cell wall biosynthesis